MQGKKVDTTPLALFNFFVERVKENLHLILAMSPIGDAFRNRLRMFPALINCCTIDWYYTILMFKIHKYIREYKFLFCEKINFIIF